MDLSNVNTSNRSNSKSTKIILLGTGTPVPDPTRSGPSVAIIIGGPSDLIDFGPGVVR